MSSSKPSNLKACDPSYKGLIHHKAVGVEPAANSKGVLMKWRTGQQKPTPSYVWTTSNKNAQAPHSSIVHMIHENKYCPDLWQQPPAESAPPGKLERSCDAEEEDDPRH